MNKKTTPILLAFLCMGFGDLVGPLVSQVKDSFELTYFLAFLLTFSGFIMFGMLSIPLGIYQDRKGKKHTLFLGLLIAFIGLLIPVLNGMYGPKLEEGAYSSYKFFTILISVFLLGTGATILQVSGNPIMRDVSDESKYSSNLSLGQAIKAIGSSLGFLLPPAFALWFGLEWSILFPVYAFLLFVTLIWVSSVKIVEKKNPDSKPVTLKTSLSLLGKPYVLMMVFAIFLYVGAELSMSSGVPLLMEEVFNIEGFALWISWSLFFLPILIGRFTGSAILRIMPPKIFLLITIAVSFCGILLLLFGSQILAFAGIVLVGLGFANIFPLIFSITIDSMPERTNELSGLMVSAIVGGAIVPLLFGFVAGKTTILLGFIVPMICLVYISFAAISALKMK